MKIKNILTALVNKVHTRRQQIDTLFSLIGINLFVAGLSFVTTMMIANVLGKESFGDFTFAVVIGTYGLMFIQYGLEKSLVRELVHFPMRFGELLKASLILRSMLFALFLLFLLIFVITLIHRPGFSWGMVLVIIATALTAFQLGGVYDAWNAMQRHSIYLLIEKCIYFALVWGLILTPLLTLSLELIGVFMIISAVAGLFLQYRWALPQIDFKPIQGTWLSTVYISRSNSFIWLAVLSGLSIEYLSQIILKCYAGSAELGVYSVGWRITQFSILFLSQAGRIGAESMARHTRPEIIARDRFRFLIRYAALMTAMGFLIGLPLLLFPKYILMVLKPEYSNAAETIRILSLYPLLFGPYLAVLQYVISSRMNRTYFILLSAVGILSSGLSFLLIPQMQSTGAAVSVIVSLAIALILFTTAAVFHIKYMHTVTSVPTLNS